MSKEKTGINLMVCGSQRFTDKNFVFKTLDMLYYHTGGNFNSIITSEFSGACKFAEEWAENKNAQIEDGDKIVIKKYLFDHHLLERNHSVYEDLELPPAVLQNDPFFQKGKELFQKYNIDVFMAFPNEEKELGVSTKNLTYFAKLAIPNGIFDCSEIWQQLYQKKDLILQEEHEFVAQEPQAQEESSLGFTNKHPGKKFK